MQEAIDAAIRNCNNDISNKAVFTVSCTHHEDGSGNGIIFKNTCGGIFHNQADTGTDLNDVLNTAKINSCININPSFFTNAFCMPRLQSIEGACDTTCEGGQMRISSTRANYMYDCMDCPGNTPVSDGETCRACEANEEPNPDKSECICKSGFEEVSGSCVAECGTNEMRNTAGNCICVSGFEEVSGSCVPECEANEMRNTAGNCICVSGFEKVSGSCEPECGMNEMRNTAGDCVCVSGYTKNNANECMMNPTPTPCGANEMRNPAGNCVCVSGYTKNNANECEMTTPAPPDCTAPEIPDGAGGCTCPAANQYRANGETHCVAALPPAGRYTVNECENADWTASMAVNAGLIRETCEIRYRVVAEFTEDSPPSSSALRAQQTTVGDSGDGCILRENAGFAGAALASCEDVFKGAGLPVRPTDFTSGGVVEVLTTGITPFNIPSPASSGKSDRASEYAAAIGIMVLVGALIHGDLREGGSFSFNPEYSFSSAGGLSSYFYGSRLDYDGGDFSAYWTAAQSSGEDSWRYAGGFRYTRENWRAGFAGVNLGRNTEMDFDLSANLDMGGWLLEGGAAADLSLDEFGEFESAANINTGALLDYYGWDIKPSAGLYWREGEAFGDSARFRIKLRREF